MGRGRVDTNYELTRGRYTRNTIALTLYLATGWKTYRQIADEFGCCTKTARRRLAVLEETGLPVEWRYPEHRGNYADVEYTQAMRLPLDWVERTPWLRKYLPKLKELK